MEMPDESVRARRSAVACVLLACIRIRAVANPALATRPSRSSF